MYWMLLMVALGFQPPLERAAEELQAGRPAEAARMLSGACPAVLDPAQRGSCELLLGMAYQGSGRLEESRRRFEAAAPLLQTGGEAFSGALAMAYRYRGELEGSEALLRRALEIQSRLSDPLPAAATRRRIAALLCARGRLTEAELEYRAARVVFDQTADPLEVERAELRATEAHLLLARGYTVEARRIFLEVSQKKATLFGADHPRTAQSLRDLATALEAEGEHDRAVPLFRRAAFLEKRTR